MVKTALRFWKQPSCEDLLEYAIQNIPQAIKPPTIVSKHDTLSLSFTKERREYERKLVGMRKSLHTKTTRENAISKSKRDLYNPQIFIY